MLILFFLEVIMTVPTIDKDTCTGCQECCDNCPAEAISMVDGKAVIDPEACAECGACVDVCPVGAITED
jgi:ferredoxin